MLPGPALLSIIPCGSSLKPQDMGHLPFTSEEMESERSSTEPKVTPIVRSLTGSVGGWVPNTMGTGQVDATHGCGSPEAPVSAPLTCSVGNPKGGETVSPRAKEEQVSHGGHWSRGQLEFCRGVPPQSTAPKEHPKQKKMSVRGS